MRISLSENLLQSIVQYLATKPYNEVIGLMQAIQTDGTIIPEPKPSPVERPKETDGGKEA